jgi:glycosyltransferase involved in cell wall biosynthesis
MSSPHLLSLNSYHYRRGGSDVVYFEHEAMFRDLGWQTAHMSMHHPKNEPSAWSEHFVDEIEFGHSYGALDRLRMAGKVIYSGEARRKLDALLGRFPATVAQVHCIYHHLSPSVLPLLKERGVPVVLTAHDLKIACPAYKMLNRGGICEKCKSGNLLHVVANRCIRDSLAVSALIAVESTVSRALGLYRRNVSRVVAPSGFYMRKLQEWGWPAAQIAYIPNYIRAERYQADFQPGSYFIYIGRLAPEKGIATLMRAAVHAGVRLKIVGTGPLEAELRALAAGTGVEMLGFQSGDALWSLVRGSRAVVLPSEWYENAPMSVLEAHALGKPVIGADIGGIPEMIENGETGFLFRSGDVEDLAQRLRSVNAADGAALRRIGQTARAEVERRFSPQRYRDSFLALYETLGASA